MTDADPRLVAQPRVPLAEHLSGDTPRRREGAGWPVSPPHGARASSWRRRSVRARFRCVCCVISHTERGAPAGSYVAVRAERGVAMSATDASRPVRESAPEAPLTAEELLRLENIVPEEDARPFGVQTRSARSFHLLDSSPGAGGEVSLEASELADGAFEIASRGSSTACPCSRGRCRARGRIPGWRVPAVGRPARGSRARTSRCPRFCPEGCR